jgi:hypothetical protein
MMETCPRCGGIAILVQSRDEFEEVPDLAHPGANARVPVKVEEYRCEETSCEYEFERIIREPT